MSTGLRTIPASYSSFSLKRGGEKGGGGGEERVRDGGEKREDEGLGVGVGGGVWWVVALVKGRGEVFFRHM